MTADGSGLLLHRSDGLATIVLNHPERANALDPVEFHGLADLFLTLAADARLQAVVLTGQGDRSFCSGLNLRNPEAIRHDLSSPGPTGLGAVLRAAARVGVPIIGRINGACVAGGMGLLGACDYAIASAMARFGLPEINHGLYPYVALAGLHGRGAAGVARRLADTGTMIDAGAALDASLVDQVCASADLDSAVTDWLQTLRSGLALPRFQSRLINGASSVDHRIYQAEIQARTTRPQIVNS